MCLGGTPGGVLGTGMIEWSQKSRPKKSLGLPAKPKKNPRLFVLYSQNYAARALLILFNTPKKSLLKSSYPKKYLPNFRTQKNPGIENFKPKKILRSSPSLEILSTPPGGGTGVGKLKMIMHQSMLSPRIGGLGIPRGISIPYGQHLCKIIGTKERF